MRFTDDELVAIALAADGYWAGPLPTIDVEDVAALAAAAFRGNRSLSVRDLLNDNGSSNDSVLVHTRDLVAATDFIAVYIGDHNFDRAAWGLATVHYPGTEWALEKVAEVGIHSITQEPAEAHSQYLASLITTAVSDGAEGLDTPDRYLCVQVSRPTWNGIVAARRGLLQVVNEDGSIREMEPSASGTALLVADMFATPTPGGNA